MRLHYKGLEMINNSVDINPQKPDTISEISLPTKENQGFLGKTTDFRNKARNIQDNWTPDRKETITYHQVKAQRIWESTMSSHWPKSGKCEHQNLMF